MDKTVVVPNDTQIAEVAVEVGLAYGPDNWNALREFAHNIILIAAAPAPAAQDEREAVRPKLVEALRKIAAENCSPIGYTCATAAEFISDEPRTATQDAQERDIDVIAFLRGRFLTEVGMQAYLNGDPIEFYPPQIAAIVKAAAALTTAQPADKPEPMGLADMNEMDAKHPGWDKPEGKAEQQADCAYARDDGSNCACGWPAKSCANPPAQPQQEMTDAQIWALWRESLKRDSLDEGIPKFARALLAAQKERT